MRRPEDYSRRAARPSLLTPAQQAEAARNRILTNLQDGGAGPRSPAVRRALLWGGGGALLVAAGALWFMLRSPTVLVLAEAGTPAAATRAAAGPADPVAAVAPVPAAATIEDAGPGALRAGVPPALPGAMPALPATVDTVPPQASSATARSPAMAVRAAPPRAGSRLAAQKIDQKIVRSQTTVVPADQQTQADAERDVTLLQALVAHDQGEPAAAPALDAQLAACRRLAPADASRCRQRVCRGRPALDGPCTAPGQ